MGGRMDGNERHDCPGIVPVPGQEECEGDVPRTLVCGRKLAHQSSRVGVSGKFHIAATPLTFVAIDVADRRLKAHGPESLSFPAVPVKGDNTPTIGVGQMRGGGKCAPGRREALSSHDPSEAACRE